MNKSVYIWLDDDGVARYASGPFVVSERVVSVGPTQAGKDITKMLLEYYKENKIFHPLNKDEQEKRKTGSNREIR